MLWFRRPHFHLGFRVETGKQQVLPEAAMSGSMVHGGGVTLTSRGGCWSNEAVGGRIVSGVIPTLDEADSRGIPRRLAA